MTGLPDISRDQVRRDLREQSRHAASELRAMRPALEAMLASDASANDRVHALVGRRRFLTIGGFGVATAAVIAACGESHDSTIARVGVASTVPPLPAAVVDDVVLLRTASSLEHSAIAVYDRLIGNADLLDQQKYGDVLKRYREDHQGHAEVFERLTTDLGGVAWTCGNPRIDEVVIAPILRTITGGPATKVEPETPASDDPKRDVLNFAHALESLAGATYQSLVPVLSQPSLRSQAIVIGSHEVRHAALLAILITGRPNGYVNPADVESATQETTTTAATTTTQNIAAQTTVAGEEPPPPPTAIPDAYAISGAFGRLETIQLVIGKPNDSGTRTTVNLETPSLNTFLYEYMDACPAT